MLVLHGGVPKGYLLYKDKIFDEWEIPPMGN